VVPAAVQEHRGQPADPHGSGPWQEPSMVHG
jgi:hypothetical protein